MGQITLEKPVYTEEMFSMILQMQWRGMNLKA